MKDNFNAPVDALGMSPFKVDLPKKASKVATLPDHIRGNSALSNGAYGAAQAYVQAGIMTGGQFPMMGAGGGIPGMTGWGAGQEPEGYVAGVNMGAMPKGYGSPYQPRIETRIIY